MIDLIISATVGAIAGSAIMRRIDLRKTPSEVVVSEIVADRDWWKSAHNNAEDFWQGAAKFWDAEREELKATLVSLADACLAKQARIDRLKNIASSQQSVKSARIIAVLSGDAKR